MGIIIRSFIFSISLLLVIACGGGGSGGGNSGTTAENDSSSSVSSASNSSSSSSSRSSTSSSSSVADNFTCNSTGPQGDDAAPPEADIYFPLKESITYEETVTVRGIAWDAGAIKSVVVNGFQARLDCPDQDDADLWLDRWSAASADNNIVEWRVTLTMPSGSEPHAITVSVTDAAGNINSSAAQVQISRPAFVPMPFTYYPQNNSVFAVNDHGDLVEVLLPGGEVNTVSSNVPYPTYVPSSFSDGKLIHAYTTDDDESDYLRIYSTDLATGHVTTIAYKSLNVPKNYWDALQYAVYDGDSDIVYMLVTFFDTTDANDDLHYIYKYDIDSEALSIVSDSSNDDQGAPFGRDPIALYDGGLLLLSRSTYDSDYDAFFRVNLDTGNREEITSPFDARSRPKFVIDSVAQRAYVISFGRFLEVNLDSGQSRVISHESEEDIYNIGEPRSVALGVSGQNVLVADTGSDAILSLDTVTGSRNAVLRDELGGGRVLGAPRELAVDPNDDRVFVPDYDRNTHKLLSIDLESGDRVSIANIGKDNSVVDVMYDPKANRILLLSQDKLLEVEPDTQTVSTLVDLSVDGLVIGRPTRAGLDQDTGRLVMGDHSLGALIDVNLETGHREIILEAEEGDPIETLTDVALIPGTNDAYIVSQFLGQLVHVDLSTGERSVVLSECYDGSGTNQFLSGEHSAGIQNLFYDDSSGVLWITADKLLRYDIEEGACIALERSFDDLDLDVGVAGKGYLVSTGFGVLRQVDPITGQSVVISK